METIREQFIQMAAGPEDAIDLIEAALMIARTAFPDLTASTYVQLLDGWSGQLRERIGPSASVGEIVSGLNQILFDREGFSGDAESYYDPQNSFLNRVLERKKGIPITLSLIYSQVGRRAGFPVHGVALPGHFIAGVFHETGVVYIDAFNRGEILTEEECRRMIEVRFGRETAEGSRWQAPAGKKAILSRMLRNLKAIYQHMGRSLHAFEMIQWILALEPDAPGELKERGLIYEDMGNDTFAARDLKRYLALVPSAPDEEVITRKIQLLDSSPQKLH
jgi:regulator of sirC expression with transglutaminase-like and TPR domain